MAHTLTLCRRWNQKEVILEVLIMPRHFPEVNVVDVGCYDFFEASSCILKFHELKQFIINLCPMHSEEGASRSIPRTPEEEVLLLTNQPVVPLLGFFLCFQVHLHLLFV